MLQKVAGSACKDSVMSGPRHATVAIFRTDLSREADQRAGLDHIIVPGVRRHPGFDSGTWTHDRDESTSFVLLTYDSLDAAEAMRQNIVDNADAQRAVGIDLVNVKVLEVSATATSD